MPNKSLENWYFMGFKGETKIPYLVCAESVEKARDKVGIFSEGRLIRALTWTELAEITGCAIPKKAEGNNIAKGGLLLEHNGKQYYLWSGIKLGY